VHARQVRRQSSILVSALRLRRADRLMARCAWCGRVNVGAEYLEHDETAELLRWWPPDRVTHSICSDCFDELERRRLG
jgi:hypothetical protein